MGVELYCTRCPTSKDGSRVRLEYKETIKMKKRAYDVYVCPTPECGESRTVNIYKGQVIGVG